MRERVVELPDELFKRLMELLEPEERVTTPEAMDTHGSHFVLVAPCHGGKWLVMTKRKVSGA